MPQDNLEHNENIDDSQTPATSLLGSSEKVDSSGTETLSSENNATSAKRSRIRIATIEISMLVVLAVIVIIIVKVAGTHSTTNAPEAWQPVATSVASEITSIPSSTYNQVGINSTAGQISPPTFKKGSLPLVFNVKGGKSLPGIFYYSAEFSPYAAAERWAFIAAISRFGVVSHLGQISSSSSDVFPNTSSLTFSRLLFSSRYIAVQAVEHYGNQNRTGGSYAVLEPLTPEETSLVAENSNSTFTFPLIDIGGRWVLTSSQYSPSLLVGLSNQDIAQGLTDPSNPTTQAIIASANYLSAAICQTTSQEPSNVCSSSGVKAADSALGLG